MRTPWLRFGQASLRTVPRTLWDHEPCTERPKTSKFHSLTRLGKLKSQPQNPTPASQCLVRLKGTADKPSAFPARATLPTRQVCGFRALGFTWALKNDFSIEVLKKGRLFGVKVGFRLGLGGLEMQVRGFRGRGPLNLGTSKPLGFRVLGFRVYGGLGV